ncbi:bromodomain adjacent to zinc finger domain protein 2A isoform X1 [Alosa pseudoharengus]|uniref:bromodomain adjacent to zinc finger domain protein 2A isoform X1 n=2 Tax=Alosa pseudoharengus TaxID=34774 RepID=UPI003F8BA009
MQMEANNHFNYGPHSSVSANSGLKLSSGESLYTNGSSMSFPQQGKNINGDMNVNGITTAIGTSQPGPHPTSSSYPHMTNHHHQGSMAYDYLWGQPQYSPAMSSGSTHGMHQKQGSPGVLQQNQHHFQSHGQYQVNGAMGASHQTPVGGAPNVSLGAGQYWNRPTPTQQQGGASMAMGYNSHSVYGGYQSQVHPGLSPAQHHQQSAMTHQGPPTHHHPHHPHPHHPHAHHHAQQQQHYGMVPNGMPYYQHQPQHQPQHPPLPSPQPQHPSQHQPLPSPQPQHPSTHQQLASPQPQHPSTHQQLASPQPQHPSTHQQLASPQPQHPSTHQQLASPQPQHPTQHQTLPSPQHVSQHQTLSSPQHPPQHQTLPSPQHPPQHQTLPSPQHVSQHQTLPSPQHVSQHQTLPSPQHVSQHQTLPSPQHPAQQHQPLPSPQHAPQPTSQMMPPTSQNFTPPRGSPQHHHLGHGASGSPLPMQVPMMSPSAIPDGGSPQSRDSPLGSSVPLPSVMQGLLGEAYKEVDKGYNGVERASVAQRLPKAEGYPARPSGHLLVPTSEYCQRVPHGGMDVEPLHMREAMHSAVSAPPPLLSTPPRQAPSGPPPPSPPVVSVHHMSATDPPPSSSSTSTSAHPQVGPKSPHGSPVSAPAPMLSSPPLMVQGLRPMSGGMSPSSMGGGPPELMPGPPPLMTHVSRSAPVPVPAPPPAVSSPSTVQSATHPSAPATSAPPLWTSAPPVSASPHSQVAYVPPQMVQGPKLQEAKPHSPVSSPSKVAQTPKPGELSKPLSPASAPPAMAPALPSGASATSWSPQEAPASSPLSASPQKAGIPSPQMSSLLSSSSQAAKSLPDALVSGHAPAAVTAPSPTAPVSTAPPPPPAAAASHRAASVPPTAASSPPVVSATPQAASVSLPAPGAPPPGAAAPPKTVSAFPAVSTPTQAATAPPGGSMPPPPPPPQPVSGLPAVPTLSQTGSAPSVSVPPPASKATSSSPPQAAGQASQGLVQQDASNAGKNSSCLAASEKEVSAPLPDEDVAVSSFSKSDSTPTPHSKSHEGLSDGGTEMPAHKVDSPAKNIPPEAGMAPATAKDHDTPRKFASLDDTYDTDSLDCTSVAESTRLESSQAEDTSVMEDTFDDSMADTSCTDEPSMFTEDSATEDSRHVPADDTQEDCDSSQVDETMDSCLSNRESGTEEDRSCLKDSVSDDSQNDTSLMSVDNHNLSGLPSKAPEECSESQEKAVEASGDGRDAPDGPGASAAAAALMPGTAGTPVSADEGWQETVVAAAEADPSPAELAAKPLPLSTSAVTVATTPPPQKPAAKRGKAAAKQASQASQKKTPAKAPKEEKEKRKRKKNEDKEPAGTRKKRKLSKDDASGSATTEVTPLLSSPDAGKAAADQSPAADQATPVKPKKPRKPRKPKQPAAGTATATTSPTKTDGEPSVESGQTPPAKPKKIRKPRKPREPKATDGAAKPPKAAKAKPTDTPKAEQDNKDDGEGSTTGDTPKRRIATEEQVHFPLLHGWKREVRVKKLEDRLKGETWYYSPCGRRMKQFPEIIKYLRRHECGVVTREHFSFSPRMPVGDFYEERDSPEGLKWFLLANEEVPSMIMAITGRRGRPPNPDKEKPRARVRRAKGTPGRRPGRPPKTNAVDLLSKVDARMLKRLQAKEVLTDEDKEKLVKIKKKMKRKARLKRKEDAKNKIFRQLVKKAKLEKAKEAKDQSQDEEKPAQPGQPQSQQPSDQQTPPPATEPKKPGRKRRVQTPEELEKAGQVKRVASARSQAKALAKAQAEAQAQAQAALAAKRQAERRAQAQRRLEERKRQQQILEELKKPTEDMCITDHQPFPELSRIPGVVLSGRAFSHCLTVVEFLHSYGKVLGLQVPKDVPSLSTLQEGLLGVGESQGEVMDLLIKLVEAALHDPGLPSYYQSVKILGEKLVDLELSYSTVSECLRIFLESHGFELDVCNSLRTKTFQALKPDVKAAILAFMVEELNASNTVTRDIDNTLENMTTYRKNKWIIEGKLRKLKAALVRRTGRSEEELCIEDRRRSTRAGTAEEESLEETTLLERSTRHGRGGVREEPKLTEAESPTNASIPELERQIDKLTKRQVFFRKKLQQASHSLRAVSLGQDRYRRRYWLMPHMGSILVEGPEEILDSCSDILVTDEPMVYVKKEVKVEVKSEEPLSPVTPVAPAATAVTPRSCSPRASGSGSGVSPTEVDPLPGEASLMSSSSPRGRGRPRKIKPEVELHLRTAKCRRRRRSSKSVGEESLADTAKAGIQTDLTQAAVTAWLSQAQVAGAQDPSTAAAVLAAVAAGGRVPEDGGLSKEAVKELTEKQAQWFPLLPKTPSDATALSEPCLPSPNATSPTSLMKDAPPSTPSLQAAPTPLTQTPLQSPVQPGALTSDLPALLPLLPGSAPVPPACSTPVQKPTRRRRRGSSPARRPYSRPGTGKRRGRPPSTLFSEIEQKYLTQLVAKPIPKEMAQGWWWVKAPEELAAVLQALHPRGVREKVLHKHLTKHLEFLSEVCSRPSSDPVFKHAQEEGSSVLEVLNQPWPEVPKALQTDISALQWVEDLEQRVAAADLHLKMAPQSGKSDTEPSTEEPVAGFQAYTVPEADSTRKDLEFYDHEVDPRDDWIVRTKREWSDLLRVPNNPLDLAVLRLANLERNIERRYLKEPLWNLTEVVKLAPLTPPPGEDVPMDVGSLEMEITPRLRTWRQGLDRCRSAAQLSLCIIQLERAIAWEKSVVKVTCQVCRKGDNDEYLLLCDGCDRGCHMFCLRPKVTEVPEGDWYCPICVAKMDDGEMRPQRSARQRARRRKRRLGAYIGDSSEEEESPRRLAGMSTRQKDGPSSSASSTNGNSGISPSKRRRMTTRNQPDLTYCEIILMEMEAHADAWPFLEPVNPRLVPGYRRIIKNPMDFLTMRERLLQGGYCSVEEFAADAQLVFNNCELFNEDTSEVGKAGHSMRRFFENRWAEFYQTRDKDK